MHSCYLLYRKTLLLSLLSLAVSMLISRYALTTGSQEERWLQENIPLLKQELSSSHEDVFYLRLHELCMARCYFYSNKVRGIQIL
jgi:hypothetical protein